MLKQAAILLAAAGAAAIIPFKVKKKENGVEAEGLLYHLHVSKPDGKNVNIDLSFPGIITGEKVARAKETVREKAQEVREAADDLKDTLRGEVQDLPEPIEFDEVEIADGAFTDVCEEEDAEELRVLDGLARVTPEEEETEEAPEA